MKTAELTGAQLDYWVAKAQGLDALLHPALNIQQHGQELTRIICSVAGDKSKIMRERFEPSTNWAHGGPIKERMRIGTYWIEEDAQWRAGIDMHGYTPEFNVAQQHGRTELEAAMRCMVASKFGDDLPV